MKRLALWLFIFLGISNQAITQVTVSRPVAGISSNTDANTYSFGSFTPTSGAVLVVFVVATGTAQLNPTISNTGTVLSWTLSSASTVSGTGYYIFWARVPSAVAASVITFNCAADQPTGINMSIHSFVNTNRFSSNPLVQTKVSTATTTSTNANITFDKALKPRSGYVIGWSGLFTGNNNSTAPGGFTESDDLGRNEGRNLTTARRSGGLSTAGPLTFTNGSTTWVVMGVEVDWFKRDMPPSLLEN